MADWSFVVSVQDGVSYLLECNSRGIIRNNDFIIRGLYAVRDAVSLIWNLLNSSFSILSDSRGINFISFY